MKNFMQHNTVTHNLMSFSAFKAIYIFALLMEGPKTYKDIMSAIESQEYINETISSDTVRIYFNSLRKVGCEIKRVYAKRKAHYYIEKHPFELNISDSEIESIIKIYKAISNSIDLSDYFALTSFFEKIEPYILNQDLKEKLQNISPLSNIDMSLIKDLQNYAKNNNEIAIKYKSSSENPKVINIIPDKLYINNGKLYISGYNSEYENYGSFLVSKILKIVSASIENSSKINTPTLAVKYEILKNDMTKFVPIEGETILSENNEKILVEIVSKNKFVITQRILSHTNKCKVISPKEYKDEIVSHLKQMKEAYIGRK